MNERIDLKAVAERLAQEFTSIESMWLFGSRRHGTLSVRSDIDILVRASGHLQPHQLRSAIRRVCPALDLFIVERGKATSCMNESYVQAESFDELRTKLDALCIWSRAPHELDLNAPYEQEIRVGVEYATTVLDGVEPQRGWGSAVQDFFVQIQSESLPTKPFVGHDVTQVADFIAEIAGRVVAVVETMAARHSRASWKPILESEYDFQDAFYLAVKPWLPDLAREEVTIRYDEQDKRSDFSVLQSRIVIEMKYVRDAGSKAATVKSLSGLAEFYGRHANVEVLLFLITATRDADVDAARWAADYSYDRGRQKIITRVYTIL